MSEDTKAKNDQSGGASKHSPTQVSELALELLSSVNDDLILLEKVYIAARALLGAAPQGVASAYETKVDKKKKDPKKETKPSLTSGEIRAGEEDFRKKFNLPSLDKEQKKMVKKILLKKKSSSTPPPKEEKKKSRSKQVVSASEDSEPESPPLQQKKKKEVNQADSASQDNVRLPPKRGVSQCPEPDSKSFWTNRIKAQRERAYNKLLDAKGSDDLVVLADLYNAIITVENTWLLYQNTWKWTGKELPMTGLQKPNSFNELKDLWLEEYGTEPEVHEETHHFILKGMRGESGPQKDDTL